MPKKTNREEFRAEIAQLKKQIKEADDILEEARIKSSSGDKSAYQEVYNRYKSRIWVQLRDVFRGPSEKPREQWDKDTVLAWYKRNCLAIRLIYSRRFREGVEKDGMTMESYFNYNLAKMFAFADGWLGQFETNARIDKVLDSAGNEQKLYNDNIQKEDRVAVNAADERGYAHNMAARLDGGKEKRPEQIAAFRGFFIDADYITEDKKRFADFSRRLAELKTSHDSTQYENLIKMTQIFGKIDDADGRLLRDSEAAQKLDGLNPKQNQAYKMFFVKQGIENYLSHKAKDGVKPNVYNKLAEVEELYKYVCNRIKELNPKKFTVGKLVCDPETVPEIEENIFAGREQKEKQNVQDCMERISERARQNHRGMVQTISAAKDSFNAHPQTANIAPDYQARGSFAADKEFLEKLGQRMERAKTIRNSGAYGRIVDIVKLYGSQDGIKAPKNEQERADLQKLNGNQLQAYKLFRIKEAVNAYLLHKAKDGVNRNAYGKLQLVEELNQFLGKRINALVTEKFKVGEKEYDPNTVKEKYAEEFRQAYAENRNLRNTAFDDRQWHEVYTWKNTCSEDEVKKVSQCMDRILLVSQKHFPDNRNQYESLLAQRMELVTNPLPAEFRRSPAPAPAKKEEKPVTLPSI